MLTRREETKKLLNCGIGAMAVACTPMIASAQLAVTRVVTQGDVVAYGAQNITIGTLNAPFTNSLGKVGFTGGTSVLNNSFVWYDTGITWLNTDDVVNTVSGAEGTMGVNDAGGFIYSPSVNTFDAVYTDNGPLLKDGDALPAIPGQFSVFNSRPIMIPGGTAYWIGGYSPTSGGSTVGRVFLKCTNTADVNTITKILQTGDLIGGLAISSVGLGFAFDVCDSGNNYIIGALVGTATATDDRVLVNGAAVAAAGASTGSGDNWTGSFADMSINDSGNYVFTGDTDGATTSDEAMAYNGSVVLREGTVIGGVTLGSACNAASINNLGKIAFCWNATGGATEALFYGNAATPQCAKVILKVGDVLDTDGDLTGDAIVTDLEASGTIGPGLSLSDDNFIFVEVSTTPVAGGSETETIIKIPVDVCRADTDGNGDVNVTDLLGVIGTWGACPGCNSDTNDDCQVNVTDLLAVIGAWGFCD